MRAHETWTSAAVPLGNSVFCLFCYFVDPALNGGILYSFRAHGKKRQMALSLSLVEHDDFDLFHHFFGPVP